MNLHLSSWLIEYLKKQNQTISCAESCTGGMLSELLTRKPGASEVFMGAAICYSYAAKTRLLSIDTSILESFGAVSEEVALLMAKNSRELFSSTFSLSITGIAGPDGGLVDKPIGTVCFGLATPNKLQSQRVHMKGDSRQKIRKNACLFAIEWFALNIR